MTKLAGAANLLWRTSPPSANRRELRDDETAPLETASVETTPAETTSVGTTSVETTNWDEDLNERESRHSVVGEARVGKLEDAIAQALD